MTEAVDQPALGHDLHPGADAGSAGADPHQAEVAILEGFENSAQRWRQHGLRADCGSSVYLRTSTQVLALAIFRESETAEA